MSDLRAIAEAATPGPWTADPGPDYDPTDWVVFGPNSQWVSNLNEPQPEGWTWNGGTSGQRSPIADALEANAAHIAAWSPDRALAALDVIEAAEALNVIWERIVDQMGADEPLRIARLEAELDVMAALERWLPLR